MVDMPPNLTKLKLMIVVAKNCLSVSIVDLVSALY